MLTELGVGDAITQMLRIFDKLTSDQGEKAVIVAHAVNDDNGGVAGYAIVKFMEIGLS